MKWRRLQAVRQGEVTQAAIDYFSSEDVQEGFAVVGSLGFNPRSVFAEIVGDEWATHSASSSSFVDCYVSHRDEEPSLILLDAQLDPSKEVDAQTFCLLAILSSCVVLNTESALDSDTLTMFDCVLQCTNHIHSTEDEEEDGTNLHKYFPRLLWVRVHFMIRC